MVPALLLAFLIGTSGSSIKPQVYWVHNNKNFSGQNFALELQPLHSQKSFLIFTDEKSQNPDMKNNQTSIEVRAGIGFPAEDYLSTHIVSGLGITIPLEKGLSLCFALGYANSAVDEVPNKLYGGRLENILSLVSLRFLLFRNKIARPYVFLGAGYAISTFEMNDIITIPEITISQHVKNGLCLQTGLGIGVHVSGSFGVFAETAYLLRKTAGVTKISDFNFGTSSQEFPVLLDAWIIQFGIEYFSK